MLCVGVVSCRCRRVLFLSLRRVLVVMSSWCCRHVAVVAATSAATNANHHGAWHWEMWIPVVLAAGPVYPYLFRPSALNFYDTPGSRPEQIVLARGAFPSLVHPVK